MRLPEPPEGVLHPTMPWSRINPDSRLWLILKSKLTGRRQGDESYTSYVNLSDADADRLIANIKKDPRGYPSLDQESGTPIEWMERQRLYQEWLVEAYLENPFREEVDNKIEEATIERRLNEIQEERKKNVEQAVELTDEIVENTIIEEPQDPVVVPTTELIPSTKKPEPEEQKPEKTRKKRSSLLGSMLKTFTRMENHFQKLIELTESSEADMVVISDAFRIQSDALTKGFQETTTLITRVTQAVDLQSSTMVRIAKGKKDLDQKRLDAQEALNEEVALEQQQSSSGNVRAKDIDKGSGPGGGIGGSIAKVFGGAVIGKVLAGKGLKLAQGVGGKAASKISGKVLEKALGKETAETVLKNVGKEATEAGVEKGAAKLLGKRIPLIGFGIGTFLALERAAKGDFLGAGLELASGAASTIPGGGTAASLGIDAALMARDSGMMPFAEGGLTQKSTFSTKRPGVTDLSPDLFKKMYQYEIDYEAKNKIKFGRLYAEGYEKYFAKPSLPGILSNLLGGVVEFFKKIVNGLGNFLRNNPLSRALRGLTGGGYEYTDPDTKTRISVTSRRGMRIHPITGEAKMHGGTDISTDSGTPLRAISDGEIVDSDSLSGGWGNFLVFKDDKGIFHLYGHMQSGYKRGGRVKKGDIIGKVGSTGASTGPHLHWEAGTGWNGGVITGQFDPLDRYKAQDPFFTKREEPKDKPAAKPTADTRQSYASQQITQNFGVKEGKRVYFPYNGENNFYHGYKTRTGWDIYAGKAKLDTSSEKNAGVVKAFLDYATNYLAYNDGQLSPPDPHGVELNAAGGPVKANTPIIVGDAGPEMFVPKQDGFIMNNQQTAGIVDWFDRKIFGTSTGKPVRYPSSGPRDAIEAIGGKYYAPYGPDPSFKPVRGAMMENQLNKLVAMAPLEEQMTTSVQIIRVNNTVAIPVSTSSDSSDDATTSAGNIFRDLHLASIS